MCLFPHRWASPVENQRRPDPGSDVDVLVVAGIFWVASVVRAVGAVIRHETFGTESTLALAAALAIPWAAVRGRLRPQR